MTIFVSSRCCEISSSQYFAQNFCMWSWFLKVSKLLLTIWGPKWLLPWYPGGGRSLRPPAMAATESDPPWGIELTRRNPCKGAFTIPKFVRNVELEALNGALLATVVVLAKKIHSHFWLMKYLNNWRNKTPTMRTQSRTSLILTQYHLMT